MVAPEYKALLKSLRMAKGYPTLRMLIIKRYLLATRITIDV